MESSGHMSGNKNENLVPSGGRGKYGGSRNNRNETRLVILNGSVKKVQGNQELDDAVEQGNRKSLMGYGD